MRLVYDIETDGLLDTVTKVHCIVTTDIDTGVTKKFVAPHPTVLGDGTIVDGIEYLNLADELIGHNIIGYDNIVLRKLYGKLFKPKKSTDTLILCKIVHPDVKDLDFKLLAKNKLPRNLVGRHSLEAWGYRLGEHKDHFGKETDWKYLSQEMLDYCVQDVKVNCVIYTHMINKIPNQNIIDTEIGVHEICTEQTQFGFPFDLNKARQLQIRLLQDRDTALNTITEMIGGTWVVNLGLHTPKRTIQYKDKTKGDRYEGAEFSKINIVTFNGNSRSHIAKRLCEVYKWNPTEFGKDGIPTVNEDILSHLDYPVIPSLLDYLTIEKRLGQLATGNKNWLDMIDSNNVIHGIVDTIGTVTFRCAHKNPNMGQIPSIRSKYGTECRELFTVDKDEYLLGVDLSGLELRCLSHYMYPYDNGEYGEAVVNGDIHTKNQLAAGLPTRDNAKTFIYGFLYGAGDEKIAEIIKGKKADGTRLRKKFLKNIPALNKLINAVQEKSKTGFLKGIDGRRLPVRAQYAALNTLLQSCGAIISKVWVNEFHRLMKEHGYTHGIEYKQAAYVHDELQIRCKKDIFPIQNGKSLVGDLAVLASHNAGKILGIRIPIDSEYSIGENYAQTH